MSTFFCIQKYRKTNYKLKYTTNVLKGNFKILLIFFEWKMNIILNAEVIFRDVPTSATKRQLNVCQSMSGGSKKQ